MEDLKKKVIIDVLDNDDSPLEKLYQLKKNDVSLDNFFYHAIRHLIEDKLITDSYLIEQISKNITNQDFIESQSIKNIFTNLKENENLIKNKQEVLYLQKILENFFSYTMFRDDELKNKKC